MYNVVVCSCGKSLRAHEGASEIRCPVCGKSTFVASVPEEDRKTVRSMPHEAPTEIIVFGFEPPPLPKVQLKYQVVEVSSEKTTPTPRAKPQYDDDRQPYPPVPLTPSARADLRSQEEWYGPDLDLTRDPHSPYPTRKRQRRGRQAGWALERAWHECLAYPLRGWPLVAALGFALTFATFGLLQVLREEGPLAWIFYVIGGVALAYACGFLSCVLNAGVSGDALDVRWPGADLKILGESLLAGVLSFLAGPVIPASLAVYFWIYCDDKPIDWLILIQLFAVTISYWLLVFFSAALGDNWSSLLPNTVFRRARQLGIGRTFIALGIVNGVFLIHSWLAIAGLENHRSAASFILLLFCWSSLLFWMVFVMRWLGVCMFRIRKGRKEESPGPAAVVNA